MPTPDTSSYCLRNLVRKKKGGESELILVDFEVTDEHIAIAREKAERVLLQFSQEAQQITFFAQFLLEIIVPEIKGPDALASVYSDASPVDWSIDLDSSQELKRAIEKALESA